MKTVNETLLDDSLALFALSRIEGVGRKTFELLLQHFGSLRALLGAGPEELMNATSRVSPAMAQAIAETSLEAAAEELKRRIEQGIKTSTLADANYPSNLKLAADAPIAISMLGELGAVGQNSIAIVGSTKPAAANADTALRMAAFFAKNSFIIVSGLARGIDTAAHQGALDAQGITVAVMGNGLNRLFPPENRALAFQLSKTGILISEQPTDRRANGRLLMARNRITSGISKATIVVEAHENSGSLATGKRAMRQGRLVFGLDNSFAGNQEILQLGAQPISSDESEWPRVSELVTEFQIETEPDDRQLKFNFEGSTHGK
jgi:DNA processing protein